MHRNVTSALGIGALLVMATGVGAAAATHASSKTFSACLNSHTHALSNVTESPTKARACQKGTKRVTWGSQGPAGTKGPAGKAATAGTGGETFVPLVGFAESTEVDPCPGTSTAWQALPYSDGCPASPTTTYKSVLINSSAFGAGSTVRLDASIELDATNGEYTQGKVCVRLWDITAQLPVGSPVCSTTQQVEAAVFTMVSTAPVPLPAGDHNYKIELQLPNNDADGHGDQEGGYVGEATAVIENK